MYQRLSLARRTWLHGQLAAVLESPDPMRLVEQAGALAHYWNLSDQPGPMVPHLVKAVERAAAVFDSEAAITHFRRAQELRTGPGAHRQTVEETTCLWERVGDLKAPHGRGRRRGGVPR